MAGLSVDYLALPVWLGGTLALLVLTAVAIVVGSNLLRPVPVRVFHKVVDVVFLAIAGFVLAGVLATA